MTTERHSADTVAKRVIQASHSAQLVVTRAHDAEAAVRLWHRAGPFDGESFLHAVDCPVMLVPDGSGHHSASGPDCARHARLRYPALSMGLEAHQFRAFKPRSSSARVRHSARVGCHLHDRIGRSVAHDGSKMRRTQDEITWLRDRQLRIPATCRH